MTWAKSRQVWYGYPSFSQTRTEEREQVRGEGSCLENGNAGLEIVQPRTGRSMNRRVRWPRLKEEERGVDETKSLWSATR